MLKCCFKLYLFSILIGLLSTFDGIFTMILIDFGAVREENPAVLWLIETTGDFWLLWRCLFIFTLLGIINVSMSIRNKPPSKLIKSLVSITLISYLWVVIWEIHLLIQVFS